MRVEKSEQVLIQALRAIGGPAVRLGAPTTAVKVIGHGGKALVDHRRYLLPELVCIGAAAVHEEHQQLSCVEGTIGFPCALGERFNR